ncbi:ribbon-helix-helix domain-containing protein [Pseudoduganella violacea]|uniref:Putative addiction module CopG family antidote n=1 Tax=Pseudoduganella violacea TaxID=1715466 RepID=A0A7W5FWZ7_9BURK|nr:type II toxin-antitoxin system ParD family antitoxin [Pseudoduganella violacea]MBB3122361.1 putative addiction module CopG family antidote [Pseudoduganella violacea]
MPTTITLSAADEKLLQEQLSTGRYKDANALVAAGLQLLAEQDRQLRDFIQEGLEGEMLDGDAVFAALEAKYGKPQPAGSGS